VHCCFEKKTYASYSHFVAIKSLSFLCNDSPKIINTLQDKVHTMAWLDEVLIVFDCISFYVFSLTLSELEQVLQYFADKE
jgi:hypothetical protein